MKPKQAEITQIKREERLAQYQQVVTLRKLGFSQTAIADQVGVAHSTVSRWLSCGTFPEQQPRPRKMELDFHFSSLAQRWEAGCRNIAELHRELVRERGKRWLPLTRIYRHLFYREWYLIAYGKRYRNQGAMTQSVTNETVDSMSLMPGDSKKSTSSYSIAI